MLYDEQIWTMLRGRPKMWLSCRVHVVQYLDSSAKLHTYTQLMLDNGLCRCCLVQTPNQLDLYDG